MHLWTRCLPLYYADVLGLASGDEGQRSMTPNATRVVLHNQHDARLISALGDIAQRNKQRPLRNGWPDQWRGRTLNLLLRWSIINSL